MYLAHVFVVYINNIKSGKDGGKKKVIEGVSKLLTGGV